MAAMLRRLPASGKALYKRPGDDRDYLEVTITGLPYDTAPTPE